MECNSHGSILLGVTLFGLEHDDRTDRFALMNKVEAFVDVFELERVGNHRVDLDLSVHVPVDNLRHVGAAPRAAEGGAAPVSPGDELERARRDLLAGFGNADDDRGAPAAM